MGHEAVEARESQILEAFCPNLRTFPCKNGCRRTGGSGYEHGNNIVSISETFPLPENVGCIENGKTGDRKKSREIVIVTQEK